MCTKSGAGLALEAMRLVPQSVGLAGLAPYGGCYVLYAIMEGSLFVWIRTHCMGLGVEGLRTGGTIHGAPGTALDHCTTQQQQ
jgi:hypothetical protein